MNTQNESQPQLNLLQEFEVEKTAVMAGLMTTGEAIALRPICENLGIDWSSQHKKIQRDGVFDQLWSPQKSIGKDGKKYEMLCLPPVPFQEWLYSLSDVKSENLNKPLLLSYQKGLVIQLMIMLKISLDEIERLRAIEGNFVELAKNVRELIDKDEEGRNLSAQSKAAFKDKKEIQAKIIDDLRTNMNQIKISF